MNEGDAFLSEFRATLTILSTPQADRSAWEVAAKSSVQRLEKALSAAQTGGAQIAGISAPDQTLCEILTHVRGRLVRGYVCCRSCDMPLPIPPSWMREAHGILEDCGDAPKGVLFLGDGRFRCGDKTIQLIDTEANVLETLVSYGATSLEDLRAGTNVDCPHKVLARICRKHPELAAADRKSVV